MDDCRKCQTSAATPAEPEKLPWGTAESAPRKYSSLPEKCDKSLFEAQGI